MFKTPALLALSLIFSICFSFARTSQNILSDSTSCNTNFSLFNKYFEKQNFSEAAIHWRKAFANCPSFSKSIYINGVTMYENFVGKEKVDAIKSNLVDTLIMIYDQRIKYFGEEELVLSLKGLSLYEFAPERKIEIMKALESAIAFGGYKSEAEIMEKYFVTCSELCKQNEMSRSEYTQRYFILYDLIQANFSRSDSTNYKNLKIKIDSLYSSVLNCEDLVEFFSPKINEQSLEYLKRIVEVFSFQSCYNNEVYAQAAEKLYKYEPSAQTALNLARLFRAKEDFRKANSYYNSAIDFESDNNKKATIFIEYAGFYSKEMKNNSQAKTYALRAASLRPEWGIPYIFIGDLYLASAEECDDKLKGVSVIWAATDKYEKAKVVDPSLTKEIDNKISAYSNNFPKEAEVQKIGKTNGDLFNVSCWINETTTVRVRK